MFTNTLLPGGCREQALESTLEPYLNPLKAVRGAYLCLKTQCHFPCQVADIPILWRYGWLGLIVESRRLLQAFYKINYLVNTCADKMDFSRLIFVTKTDPCIQPETSITLTSYSAGTVNLFNRATHTEIRSMDRGSGKNVSMYRLWFCAYQSSVSYWSLFMC